MSSKALLWGGAALAIGLTSLMTSYKACDKTKVKLRGVVCLVNRLKSKATAVDDKVLSIMKPVDELFEDVLVEERKAFGDNAADDEAKRSLYKMQFYGTFENGNRFSAVGQTLMVKDVEKNLHRRIAFAKRCQADLPTESSRQNVGSNIIIIAGLPRTGSTMLHRLLSADPTTRTPLWWEQMLADEEQLPCAPEDLTTDPRADTVVKSFEAISLVSPNALEEFNKFHKVRGGEERTARGVKRRNTANIYGTWPNVMNNDDT